VYRSPAFVKFRFNDDLNALRTWRRFCDRFDRERLGRHYLLRRSPLQNERVGIKRNWRHELRQRSGLSFYPFVQVVVSLPAQYLRVGQQREEAPLRLSNIERPPMLFAFQEIPN